MPLQQSDQAVILHTRPYRESSQLVDLFCRTHGRFRVVANGTRGSRNGASRKLQTFVPLFAHWRGRNELKTLVGAEPNGAVPCWGGRTLYIGLYINELMTRLLPEHDPHPELFDHYVELLRALPVTADVEPLLRRFELMLLEQLGYGVDLDTESVSGTPVEPQGWYRFVAEEGFVLTREGAGGNGANVFIGADLQAMAVGNYSSENVRRTAKRLLRIALEAHLGGRPLRSREFFRGLSSRGSTAQ